MVIGQGWKSGRMEGWVPNLPFLYSSILSFTSSLPVATGLIFVNPAHPFEEFLGIRSADFLAFRSVAIILTIAGPDWLRVSLLAFQLRDKFSCHFMSP